MITRSFEEELQINGRLVCPNQGTSMLPLIRHGKDLMVILPRPDRRLKRFEAVLFRRGDSYVLHRVFKASGDAYIMCADNLSSLERVEDNQIIGVLHAVLRDGRNEIRVTSLPYRIYVFIWCCVRTMFRRVIHRWKKLLRS